MRFYLRGRITKHIGWVLPIGGTRPMSWQPRQPRRAARPASPRLRRFAWMLLAAAVVVWVLIGVFVLAR